MNSRAIIKQSIEFWTKKELAFEAYFNLKKIEDIIYLCEIITENRYNKKELILNFINGLALSFDYLINNEPYSQEVSQLIQPVIDLIAERVESDSFQLDVLKQKVTGQEIIVIDGVTTPLTSEEYLLYIKDTDDILISGSDFKPMKKRMLAELRNVNMEVTMKSKTKPNSRLFISNLADAFETISKWKYIMELLVLNGYIQPNTYLWKDETKGAKGFLVGILKQLGLNGFYKTKHKLTNEEIMDIALNNFNLKISIDTVKHSSVKKFELAFIPLSSTVK